MGLPTIEEIRAAQATLDKPLTSGSYRRKKLRNQDGNMSVPEWCYCPLTTVAIARGVFTENEIQHSELNTEWVEELAHKLGIGVHELRKFIQGFDYGFIPGGHPIGFMSNSERAAYRLGCNARDELDDLLAK